MRAEGKDVGLIRLRLWRPFPFAALRAALAKTETLITIDRAISFGGPGGPVCGEIKAALYGEAQKPDIVSFVAGLGGRDITVKDYEAIVARGEEIALSGSDNEYEIYGVRE